ncbi:hypothetical protein [Paludisphaera borealis]|uniref:Uncharacterized protein n=1 Tax=Paludisphaera borealis TaxID=1387353 RepID=A0A1U7CVP2_9BACT|nr:hypothetical protein [Paludisphaera borealis]APW62959.1 hypothetical protein BSF38_04515 [Paludisphaera borealis]
MGWHDSRAALAAHTSGVPRGEQMVSKRGREPGRDDPMTGRTARDATSINAADREPIDPRMPHLPPA